MRLESHTLEASRSSQTNVLLNVVNIGKQQIIVSRRRFMVPMQSTRFIGSVLSLTCSHSISLPGDAKLLSPRAMYLVPGCSLLRLEKSTSMYFAPEASSRTLDSTTPYKAVNEFFPACPVFSVHENLQSRRGTAGGNLFAILCIFECNIS